MFRPFFPTLLSLLIVVANGAAHADDWPEWLGPNRDSVSKETGWLKKWPASGPPVAWERSIGSGYSSLTIKSKQLMLFHRKGDENIVERVDALNGRTAWKFAYATSYVDRYGYDGGPRCAPQIIGESVYTLDPDGTLYALSFDAGKVLWKRELRAENKLEQFFFGTGATPLIIDGKIYCHVGGSEIAKGSGLTFCLDAKTGKTLWKTPNFGGSYASPVHAVIDDVPFLFVFHRGGLSAMDPATGKEHWMYRWHSRVFESVNAATPVVKDDLVLFTATYGTGAVCLKVSKEGYKEVWRDKLESRNKTLEVHWAPPLLVDGHVFGFSGRHANGCTLNCIELETGDLLWRWPGFLHRGSMIYSDGHYIALGETGDLAVMKLSPKKAEPEVISRIPKLLKYPAWTVPTLSNQKLYVRDLNKLICLDLSAPESKDEAKK